MLISKKIIVEGRYGVASMDNGLFIYAKGFDEDGKFRNLTLWLTFEKDFIKILRYPLTNIEIIIDNLQQKVNISKINTQNYRIDGADVVRDQTRLLFYMEVNGVSFEIVVFYKNSNHYTAKIECWISNNHYCDVEFEFISEEE